MFDIDNNEKEILAVGYKKETIETKDKWNQINILDMQSLLGTNCRRPLLHMSKSYIWLEGKNQRINEFSIGYMMNIYLNSNKAFREQVKVCLKNTFGPDTNIHISKILSKKDTRVLALVIFYENRKEMSCVIYTIIGKYVCIHYSGSEKSKLSDLHLGDTGKDKHNDTDYDNVLGTGIPDLLLNLLSCHGFLKNNEYVVMLKCTYRMSEYYFNKGFVIFECDEEN